MELANVLTSAVFQWMLPTTGAAIMGILILALVIIVIGVGIKIWNKYNKH